MLGSTTRGTQFAAVVCVLGVAVAGCSAEAPQDPAASGADTSEVGAHGTAPNRRVVVKHRVIRVEKRIPFTSETVDTSTLKKGVSQLQQAGRAGVRTRVVRVTIKNGREIKRDLVRTFVSRPSVERVRLVGTRVDPKPEPKPQPEPANSCDPNYSGACVPVASDVDCGGGSGDGPEYVDGPVMVTGSDVYDLDRDGDGIACDA